ncbi:ComF family protein [Roseicitreum antarcticum]|uniref:Predicted amidophosphoribosyltransferases n=1 Tax=Roseicitreum antarcticum TaxID=564137 RepID=A0A1H3AK27_9RHOB|nr:Predicted amidophosphoribosyltransferases [Roseicitreum antarcticum]
MKLQKLTLRHVLRVVYPPQCLTCDTPTVEEHALCPACWSRAGFIGGLVCDGCGIPLPGEAVGGVLCDDCLTLARPWTQGRAAMLYGDRARYIVLGLKYGDRLDYGIACGRWMARAVQPMLQPDMLVVPVPLHWRRFAQRRYNQAAILSAAVARVLGAEHCPDLLVRPRPTGTQDGRGRMGRFDNMQAALIPHKTRGVRAAGRNILLVDDVMTSGATFAAATEACIAAGAASVRVVALARVAHAD